MTDIRKLPKAKMKQVLEITSDEGTEIASFEKGEEVYVVAEYFNDRYFSGKAYIISSENFDMSLDVDSSFIDIYEENEHFKL